MNKLNLENVRMILDSYSRMNPIPSQLGLPFGLAYRLQDGYSACYTITEKQHIVKENHKIGFNGNQYLGLPSESFYQCDLRSILKKSENPYAGFYEIVYANSFQVGDITSVEVSHNNEKLFDIPFLIIGEDKNHFFIKPIIELFEAPPKKSFKDIITRNQYWDCGKVEKEELTQKYKKLETKDVIPDRYIDDDEDAA